MEEYKGAGLRGPTQVRAESMEEKRFRSGIGFRIAALAIALAAGAVAGGIVWGLVGTSALFGAYLISFPFAVLECFLLEGTGAILDSRTRVRGVLSILGRILSAAFALGLSFLFLHFTHGDYLYLLASATALFLGYLCGILSAQREGGGRGS